MLIWNAFASISLLKYSISTSRALPAVLNGNLQYSTLLNTMRPIVIVAIAAIIFGITGGFDYLRKESAEMKKRHAAEKQFGETLAELINIELRDDGLPIEKATLYTADYERVLIEIKIKKENPSNVFKP